MVGGVEVVLVIAVMPFVPRAIGRLHGENVGFRLLSSA